MNKKLQENLIFNILRLFDLLDNDKILIHMLQHDICITIQFDILSTFRSNIKIDAHQRKLDRYAGIYLLGRIVFKG